MPGRREFEIAFVGLKPGPHEYLYELDDRFFEDRPEQPFTDCKARVKLTLDKHVGFLLLKFEVGGTLGLTCDRCGNPLTKTLWDDFEMVVKMVDEPEAMNDRNEDPDVFFISRTESHLDVADWLYEFVNLSIPTHPVCDPGEDGEPTCDPKALEVLRRMDVEAKEQPSAENPIWKGLDRFRNS